MRFTYYTPLFCAILISLCLPEAARAAVETTIDWDYRNFPLKIELYEPSPRFRNMVSKTGNIPLKEPVPALGKKWPGHTKKVTADSGLPFVLVIRNDTDQDYFFSAAPHTVDPPEAALGHLFECLCNHSIFRVRAKSVWYRVVRINFWQPYPHSKLKLVHSIIGVPAADAENKLRNRLFKE